MDGDFVLDLDEVMYSLENGEVISLSFQTFNKALVVDTRCSEREGPLVCVCPVVESPRERIRALRKMRPAFPRANNLTVIPWPKSVASLVSLGVWDRLVSRFESEGAARSGAGLRHGAGRAPVPREVGGRSRTHRRELPHDLVGNTVEAFRRGRAGLRR